MAVKLYTNSNAKLLLQDSLVIGTPLVVFDARVMKEGGAGDDGGPPPSVFLTSCKYTRAITNDAPDGGAARPIDDLEGALDPDGQTMRVLRRFVGFRHSAAKELDRAFAQSRGGRSLLSRDPAHPLTCSLSRPASLAAYAGLFLRGSTPGGGAGDSDTDDGSGGGAPLPRIGVAELLAIRDGNADFSRALTVANAGAAIGMRSSVPTGAFAAEDGFPPPPKSASALWCDRIILLQNMQVVRAVVRARVVAVLRVVFIGPGQEAAGLISVRHCYYFRCIYLI
jgi:hypothetical protein